VAERLLQHPLVVDRASHFGVADLARRTARRESDAAVLEAAERRIEGGPRVRLRHPAEGHPTDDDARQDASVI
jgi:hypothetical protein